MVQTFDKKAARSGHVNYIQEPIILKNNSRTVRHLIPHFIKRSAGEQLCLKIETTTKTSSGVLDFNKTQSISLGVEETRNLVEALPQLLRLSELSGLGKAYDNTIVWRKSGFQREQRKRHYSSYIRGTCKP